MTPENWPVWDRPRLICGGFMLLAGARRGNAPKGPELLRQMRLCDPVPGFRHFRISKKVGFRGNKRREHAESHPQPSLVGDERDTMELTPMFDPEGGVVPQRL
jgi:hypothetical protein